MNKNICFSVLLFLVCILSISAISAAENTAHGEVINEDNNKVNTLETNIPNDNILTSKENFEINLEENNDDNIDKSGTDETTTDNDDELSFTDLNMAINGNANSTIYLYKDYKYDEYKDSNFQDGIYISRDLTIYGNGVTIDGNNMAKIFNLIDSKLNVNFYNIKFINGHTSTGKGGAILGGNAYNCNFINNYANYGGGAIYAGNAYDCLFIQNKADYDGGAINYGNAYNCTFIENEAKKNGGAIYAGNVNGCIFINNTAEKGGAMRDSEATSCIFIQNIAETYGGSIYFGNATNCIFQNNNAKKTGGALNQGNAFNCTFIENKATENGGALDHANAYNCTFKANNAKNGQAIYEGTACLCRFNGDSTKDTEIIPAIINVLNYTSTYKSGEKLYFNLTANDMVFDRFNITIEIYKDGQLYTTVYGLSGEGWVVNLYPGEYTAVLSLTDYPEEKQSNTNITILPSTFNDLNITINGNNNSTIFLSLNYKYYDNTSDFKFLNGVPINRNLTIYGNGATIDGNNLARIFDVKPGFYVEVYNINFINGFKVDDIAGALLRGNAYYCTFTNNNARYGGGAIYGGDAYYCTFIGNIARNDYSYDDICGGAIYGGNAYNCTFINNYADNCGGAINNGSAYNCTFINNTVKDGQGGAINNGSSYNCTFINNTGSNTYGGAISNGSAYNCIFINNTVNWGGGGALFNGDAYNCIFNNNDGDDNGGAIYGGNAYNCTFTQNKANIWGGAIYYGNAYNCTFSGNVAYNGEAIYEGRASLCYFNNDSVVDVKVIPATLNVLNFTSNYKSGERLKFNLTADGHLFDGFNTTINIYKDGSLITTVYGLTGKGWIVDLRPGEYTAVLSLVDYPEEEPSNATIIVKQDVPFELTFADLNITINSNNNSTIFLSKNCKYNGSSDDAFKKGIVINRDLTVYGNGVTIDGMDMARIFKVENNANVKFYNINFRNGKADEGGAIYGGNVYNCTFTNNTAEQGGAMIYGNAYNCTFIENKAERSGGAIRYGNATNCIFTKNKAERSGGALETGIATGCIFLSNIAENYGGAVHNGNATSCTFQNNFAKISGGAMNEGNAYNCNFTGNKADKNGGAINNGNATNCIFTQNQADEDGGALWGGNAYDCTFLGNIASEGEAMYEGTACLCIFNGDSTKDTDFIPAIINVLNYTSGYNSGEKLKFNLTLNDIVFDGFNTTINIYKDGQLYTTVYGLSGEGWIVDLGPGEYIGELSIQSYPEVRPINTTINVSKGITTVVIGSIIDAVVGKEIKINFTSNNTGFVTIKVNDQEITKAKFTPTASGTYNLSIEIAENEYYYATSNQTTFTVAKAASKIIARPVTTTYNVGKNLIITLKNSNGKPIKGEFLTVNLGSIKKYKTDSKGQIKINIAKITPKTYNAKITYAGSNNYKKSSVSVKVTVKKALPKITAKSVNFKFNVKTKKYTVIFKDNKNKALKSTKVTLKVNGKTYTVKTNSKGQGVFKITNLNKKGTYTAVITVPTNKYYKKVSKNVKIAVN